MAEERVKEGAMAAAAPEEEDRSPELAFSFMDKVRFMMYGEQEKEAFLIEKKEKEEKKKAKRAAKLEREAKQPQEKKREQSRDGGGSSTGDRSGPRTTE